MPKVGDFAQIKGGNDTVYIIEVDDSYVIVCRLSGEWSLLAWSMLDYSKK